MQIIMQENQCIHLSFLLAFERKFKSVCNYFQIYKDL